ncbi:Epidermal patterning factor-like protein [Psidium guajava]|nr:Epidermal patterning factor-like protein [Psidium guajava]
MLFCLELPREGLDLMNWNTLFVWDLLSRDFEFCYLELSVAWDISGKFRVAVCGCFVFSLSWSLQMTSLQIHVSNGGAVFIPAAASGRLRLPALLTSTSLLSTMIRKVPSSHRTNLGGPRGKPRILQPSPSALCSLSGAEAARFSGMVSPSACPELSTWAWFIHGAGLPGPIHLWWIHFLENRKGPLLDWVMVGLHNCTSSLRLGGFNAKLLLITQPQK